MFEGVPYNLYLDTDLCRVSIDNIRLRFEYKYQTYSFDKHSTVATIDEISRLLDNQWFSDLEVIWTYHDFFKIGTYCRTCTISGMDFSFAVMIGRYCYDNSCKLIAPEAVMDYNPNKVPMDVLQRIVSLLRSNALSIDVKRYDVAFDFPLSRDEVGLVKDKTRDYRLFDTAGAVTEYQGKRSSHGALKLYDKTRESDLPCPVTRCEITVEYEKQKSLADVFPKLYHYSSTQLDLDFSRLPFPVQACIVHPDMIDLLRKSCDPKTFRKHMALVNGWSQTSLIPTDWSKIDNFARNALISYTRGWSA